MEVINKVRGAEKPISIDTYPDKCPVCHNGMQATYIDATLKGYDELQAIFLCPINVCKSYFIGKYSRTSYRDLSGTDYYLNSLAPYSPEPERFGEIISELSSDFCSIYNQAMFAEKWRLDKICGPGYRKSLEYLVKDYLIKAKPDEETKIKSMRLGKCIETYIADSKVRACAERAAWLGNDETHYFRKWVDKDLQDLKILIKLTVNFVESDLLAAKYSSEMNSGNVG